MYNATLPSVYSNPKVVLQKRGEDNSGILSAECIHLESKVQAIQISHTTWQNFEDIDRAHHQLRQLNVL